MSAFNLNKITVHGSLNDVSTAQSIYIPIPDEFDGEIVEIRTGLGGVVTTADATITPSINGVAMTNGDIVITAPSVAGQVNTSRPTSNNVVRAGEAVQIESDGASTGPAHLEVTLVILR